MTFLLGRIAWIRPPATDVARSMVCLCVCLSVRPLVTFVSSATMAEAIEMPFGGLTLVGPRNYGGQDPTNPFTATRGDKSAMRPCAKLL